MADFPVDMPTTPCKFCDGTGTMRQVKRYGSRTVDEDEITESTALIGERCPICLGRGLTGVLGFGPLSS